MRKRLWDLAKSRIEIATILPGHRHNTQGGPGGGAAATEDPARGRPETHRHHWETTIRPSPSFFSALYMQYLYSQPSLPSRSRCSAADHKRGDY